MARLLEVIGLIFFLVVLYYGLFHIVATTQKKKFIVLDKVKCDKPKETDNAKS